jgi:transposase
VAGYEPLSRVELLVLLAERDRRIAQLEAENAELARRVARLERLISRNSGNSSMPPSADDLPGRPPPQARPAQGRGKRLPGKQPGAPGSAMSWAEPDDVEDHYPAGACACGADLRGAEDLGVARSVQQLEIPEVSARRIQHDLHRARCRCGREHVAPRPAGVPDAAVSIGPRLRALAVYLVVFQHVPIERCRRLIADVAGAEVSAGFIHSCLSRAADLVADVVALIKTLITAAHVAGFDETTLRAGPAGTKKYVLGAFTELYSLFFLGSRTLESFRDFGILPGFGGVVVSDRYQNYFHAGWEHIVGHQACCAHLIRDFEDAAQCWPGRGVAGPGATGVARSDPRLACRPRAGPRRDPRRSAGPADLRVPPRSPGRAL